MSVYRHRGDWPGTSLVLLFILLGWAALAIVAALLMGRFIAAGKRAGRGDAVAPPARREPKCADAQKEQKEKRHAA
jgi:hypothetical protein